MVLVDTSVWIRFLRQIEPYASGLEALLNRDAAVGNLRLWRARAGRTAWA
jgi:hypothetical protein